MSNSSSGAEIVLNPKSYTLDTHAMSRYEDLIGLIGLQGLCTDIFFSLSTEEDRSWFASAIDVDFVVWVEEVLADYFWNKVQECGLLNVTSEHVSVFVYLAIVGSINEMTQPEYRDYNFDVAGNYLQERTGWPDIEQNKHYLNELGALLEKMKLVFAVGNEGLINFNYMEDLILAKLIFHRLWLEGQKNSASRTDIENLGITGLHSSDDNYFRDDHGRIVVVRNDGGINSQMGGDEKFSQKKLEDLAKLLKFDENWIYVALLALLLTDGTLGTLKDRLASRFQIVCHDHLNYEQDVMNDIAVHNINGG